MMNSSPADTSRLSPVASTGPGTRAGSQVQSLPPETGNLWSGQMRDLSPQSAPSVSCVIPIRSWADVAEAYRPVATPSMRGPNVDSVLAQRIDDPEIVNIDSSYTYAPRNARVKVVDKRLLEIRNGASASELDSWTGLQRFGSFYDMREISGRLTDEPLWSVSTRDRLIGYLTRCPMHLICSVFRDHCAETSGPLETSGEKYGTRPGSKPAESVRPPDSAGCHSRHDGENPDDQLEVDDANPHHAG